MPVSQTRIPRTTIARRSIGLVSTYPPRLCGLATFAAALARSLDEAGEAVTVVTVGDGSPPATGSTHPELRPDDPASLEAAAALLSQCDAVIVQHEYGIYGGRDGDEVLGLMRRVHAPTIVVLHTVLRTPTEHQRFVLERVVALASLVVVMTEAARERLLTGYAVDPRSVVTIPHGAWTLPSATNGPAAAADRPVQLLSWGLLGPGKGIEHVIRALGMLGPLGRPVRYTVAGATHPNVLAREGDRYRDGLVEAAGRLGAGVEVCFDDTYRELPSLRRLVHAADIVILPYDSPDQVTSGVLVDAIAAGKPVIATAFPHAVELLADGAGIVVPRCDAAALAEAITRMVDEPALLATMSAKAREIAPSLSWRNVADRYRALCDDLVRSPSRAAV